MKNIALLLLCVAALVGSGCITVHHERATLETRIYPVSKAAIQILIADAADIQKTDAHILPASLVGCSSWPATTRPGIFERYGVITTPGSSLIYDGEVLLIADTATNHRKIQTVLGIIEDTLRLRELKIDTGPIDPLTQEADEK